MRFSRFLLLLVVGCGGGGGGSGDDDAPSLDVLPATVRVPAGRNQYFVADGATTWSVAEGDAGGTIDADGGYLAPTEPGTYHVRAENDDEWGEATVEVIDLALEVVVGTPGGPGSAIGSGSDARFASPYGIVSDGADTLFVSAADVIYQIDVTTGEVGILAGTPYQYGSDDGVGAAARFYSAFGLAYGDGVVYVAANGNATIRAIDVATREVTTIAGTVGVHGDVDAIGTAATFRAPFGLALSGDGAKLYVSDPAAATVRAVD